MRRAEVARKRKLYLDQAAQSAKEATINRLLNKGQSARPKKDDVVNVRYFDPKPSLRLTLSFVS